MKSNKFFILTLMFLTLFLFTLGEAEAVCVNITTNTTYSSNNQYIELCPITHYVNSSTISGGGAISITGSNITIVGTGSVLFGNSSGYCVAHNGGVVRLNNRILNVTCNNYTYGYYFLRQNNLTIDNVVANNMQMEASFFSRVTNSTIKNSIFNNSYFSSGFSHCMYMSQGGNDTYNNIIENNSFSHCVGNGLHINSVTTARVLNITVRNNYFYNNSFNINDFGCENCNFYNNILNKSLNYALRLSHDGSTINFGAYNNNYYNNTFADGDTFGQITIRDSVNQSYIYNNTYLNRSIVNIRIGNSTKGWFDETARMNITYTSPASGDIYYNYVGRKIFNFTDNLFTITNQALSSPYNDVYNVSSSSILQSNVDNYSITLTSGQQILITYFKNGSVSISPQLSGTYSINSVLTNVNASTNEADNFSSMGVVLVDLSDSTITNIQNTTDSNFSRLYHTFNLDSGTNYIYYGYLEYLDGSYLYTSNFSFYNYGDDPDCASQTEEGLFDAMQIVLILIGLFILMGGFILFRSGIIEVQGLTIFLISTIVWFALLPSMRSILLAFSC